ncbi:hypothetical protein BT63DRAFT_255520 [Microthyrium microscopicum]|uniref:eRF1/Pelota-like N-terminal domain-containing protein n=1 Tax=Microthyrium microscopicum TaxID=703497 RepID=A0A6A6UCC1_9PEZI|nr:hypothetical protein BT63DRAFT_255520 [Microthyrium microscopicum]
MKLVKQNITKHDQSGSVTLTPEEPEDMWHIYNLLRSGDILRAPAVRRVVSESQSGAVGSKRVHTTFTLRVTALDFDTAGCELHVSGKICVENPYAKMGSFHTLDLELFRNFEIEKADGWDSVALEMLKDSINTVSHAKVWIVLFGLTKGTANIWYMTDHRTIGPQRVEVHIPSKLDDAKATERFNSKLLETLMRLLDLPAPTTSSYEAKPLVLASPAQVSAGKFAEYMKHVATHGTQNKPLLIQSRNIVLTTASSDNSSGLSEILTNPALKAQLGDTRYARENALMDKIEDYIRLDDGRGWYGPKEVTKCVDKGAVTGGGALLMNNRLFRSQDPAERHKWVSLVDQAKAQGAEVRILSEVHESGKRLEVLGDIACICSFPVYDIEEEDDE